MLFTVANFQERKLCFLLKTEAKNLYVSIWNQEVAYIGHQYVFKERKPSTTNTVKLIICLLIYVWNTCGRWFIFCKAQPSGCCESLKEHNKNKWLQDCFVFLRNIMGVVKLFWQHLQQRVATSQHHLLNRQHFATADILNTHIHCLPGAERRKWVFEKLPPGT